MRVDHLHHLAIKVEDVERSARFYEDTLGLEERARHRDDRGTRSIWLDAGGIILMIERSETPRETGKEDFSADPPGLHLVAFRVAQGDFEAWRRYLSEQRIGVEGETPHTLYIRDPDGNRIGLSSWPEVRG